MNWCSWASSKQLGHGVHHFGSLTWRSIILLDNDILFADFLALRKNVHPLSPGCFLEKLVFLVKTFLFYLCLDRFLKIECFISNIHDQIDELWSNLNIEMPLLRLLELPSYLVFLFGLCEVVLSFFFSFNSCSLHLLFNLLCSFHALFELFRCLLLAIADDDTLTQLLSLNIVCFILFSSLAL